MRKLEVNQMENLDGGFSWIDAVAGVACGGGFVALCVCTGGAAALGGAFMVTGCTAGILNNIKM